MPRRESISFFFPAYHDAGTIGLLIEDGLRELPKYTDDFEIIIVNDGSTLDDTAAVADGLAAAHDRVRVVHHPVNLGYGAALKTGFREARKDLIFYTDGDRQFDLRELALLMERIDGAGIVSGYRIERAEGTVRRLTSAVYNWLSTRLFGLQIRDLDCAFKLIRRQVLQNVDLHINGDFVCAELFFEARRCGLTVTQVPVHHYPRTYGVSMATSPGKVARSLVEFGSYFWELRGREGARQVRQLADPFDIRRRRAARARLNSPPAADLTGHRQLDPTDG